MPPTGFPTEPALSAPGAFTETTGDASVIPYPSYTSTPIFSANSCRKEPANFSAPVTTIRNPPSFSFPARLISVRKKVGVVTSSSTRCPEITSPRAWGSSGLG